MLLHHARSLLFLPASNARAIDKARGLACDAVILDLEDAVPEDRKQDARAALKGAFEGGFGNRIGAVRVNGVTSPFHAADIDALEGVAADFIVAPKIESAIEAEAVHGRTGKPVIAMIESPQGVLNALEIAAATGVAGLFMGVNDLRHALRIPADADRAGLMFAMQAVILAARAAGKAVFDGVWNRLDDDEGLRNECREGRSIGFDGKTLIHPNQIAIANEVFGPTHEQVAEARALIAAATGGAERYQGRMIEAMHVGEARALLERAGAEN